MWELTVPGQWSVEFYRYEDGREPCRVWIDKLSPAKRGAIQAALELVFPVLQCR